MARKRAIATQQQARVQYAIIQIDSIEGDGHGSNDQHERRSKS